MKHRRLLVASLLLSLGVLVALLALLDPGQLARFARLDFRWLLAGLGVYLANYLFRAWRFRLLLGGHAIPWLRLLGIVQVHGALNYLLPARLGELAFPVLIKRLNRTEYSLGAASLLAARSLDLAALLLALPLALAISSHRLPAWAAPAALALAVAVGAALALGARWLGAPPETTGEAPTPATRSEAPSGRLRAFARRTWAHLRQGLRPRALPALIAASLGIWLCIALNFHLLLAAMGLRIDFFAAFAIVLAMIPLSLLPVQGFANLGTHEAAWIGTLALFGLKLDEANAVAAISHLVLFVYVSLLGVGGVAMIAIAERRWPSPSPSP
jgi:uncharacterized protein (TIRG00374 family)